MSDLPDFGQVNVLVVGDVMLDRYWFGDAERISPEAPVPIVSVNSIETRAGGAANVAANLTALGVRCQLIAILGQDQAGRELAGICQDVNIVCYFVEDATASTTTKLRVISRNQQLLRADFENTPSTASLAQCISHMRDVVQQADVVVFSDYGKGCLAQIETMVDIAVDAKKPIIVDPKSGDFSHYRCASFITPNSKEFESVVGPSANKLELSENAYSLIDTLALENLIITQSGQGMTIFKRGRSMHHSPANAKEVYDVSGAGDTVVAVIAACVGVEVSDEAMLRIANTAAGIVVGKLGTASVDRQELEQALSERSA